MDKIICVGKNYLKHAVELGDDVPTEPLYFLKPASTIYIAEGEAGRVQLPASGEVHHELELVFRIENMALTHFTIGLDLTIRDLQTRLKKAGQPWEKAKVFRNSAILGPWQPLNSLNDVLSTPFELKVNGTLRQHGLGSDMRWKPDELLKDVAKWFPIMDGDILFTGTPDGVGPLRPNDVALATCGKISFAITCT